jgi:DNA polymerase elongation subunit (family B)
MQFNIFKPKKSRTKPEITEKVIVDFLNGSYEKDVFGSELQGIRTIEVSRGNNDVDIIFCKAFQKDNPRITHKDGLKPFLWSKQFKTSNFFRYNVITVPNNKYSDSHVILPNGIPKAFDDTTKIIKRNSDDSIVVRYKVEDVEDWKRIVNAKQREYGIEIEELITSFDDKKIDRIEKGFKYKISIKSKKTETKFSDNPFFQKKITGCYNNLVDFFKEAGLSARGTVYLDETRFTNFFNYISPDLNSAIYFYISLYRFREYFNPFTKDSVNFDEIINFYKKLYPGISYKINKTFINELIEKDFKAVYDTLIDSGLDLKEIFKISLDENRLNLYVVDCYTFDDNMDKRPLQDYIVSLGYDFTYSIPSQIYTLNPLEQYMIQTGRRLFKGIETYEDLNVLMIDIETKAQKGNEEIEIAALKPELGKVFQIGIKSNDGFVKLLEAETPQEEADIISETYRIIGDYDPDLVLTFNGEGFDFPFIEKRLQLLGCVSEEVNMKGEKIKDSSLQYIRELMAPSYERYGKVFNYHMYKKIENSVVKVGNSTERYTQTKMFGRNFCDVMFAVKRAAEQDKSLPNAKLKDNIKHANLAKANRVYVDGDQIGKIGSDKNTYYFNNEDGTYFSSVKSMSKETKFSFDRIHEGEKGYFYGNIKNLYLRFSNENLDVPHLDKCSNIFTFDANEKSLKLSFEKMYSALVDYDGIVSTEGFGDFLRNDNVLWKSFIELKFKTVELLKDIKEIYTKYKNIDFDKYKVVTGSYIIKRYLEDDLDEPYLLDKLYSQATFSLSKWLPTSYEKISVIGNATVWKLILSNLSYLNCVAIPDYEESRKYTGGLLGMVDSGYHEDIVKIDFSSQYPATFLAHCRVPDIDITNVYKAVLEYALRSRLHYKDMKNKATDSEMKQFYDKKQLPLKILINSFYGMLGAPNVSPFCHIESAWHITCASRQNMRHMIKYFGKADFKIVYFHTDGANFVIPKGIENYSYVGTGKSWLTDKDKEYKGIEAFVAEYNDKFMIGYTGVAIDEFAVSCINFAKGNFSYLKESKGKYKISHVGGGLINKKQSGFIVDFYENNLLDLFLNKPVKFLDSYYGYIKKIYNGDLIARKIASKSKVKKTVDDYKKGVAEGRYAKQAHMELAIKNNLQVEIGDWIYYINDNEEDESQDRKTLKNSLGYFIIGDIAKTPVAIKRLEKFLNEDRVKIKEVIEKCIQDGTFVFNTTFEKFSDIHGTIKKTKVSKEKDLDSLFEADAIKFKARIKKSKKDGDTAVIDIILEKDVLYCTYIPNDKLDAKVKYNANKYINKFNKVLELVWIVFHPDIRHKIPAPNKHLKRPANERAWFTDEELQLVHGYPIENKEDKQQDINELMLITEDEYEFWEMTNLSPNSPFDYQEVFTDKMYAFDNNSLEIREFANESNLNPNEKMFTGVELMRFIGEQVIIDNENPPYRFV